MKNEEWELHFLVKSEESRVKYRADAVAVTKSRQPVTRLTQWDFFF